MIGTLEVGAVNEVDEKHVVLITDCKVYIHQATRYVWFEFLIDVGEGGEARSQAWTMCSLWGRHGEQTPGFDYISGSVDSPPHIREQGLLDLCEVVGIDYMDLMHDRVPMESIIGKQCACSIGEKEIISVSDIYHDYSWEEEWRSFSGFIPRSDLSTMPVPD